MKIIKTLQTSGKEILKKNRRYTREFIKYFQTLSEREQHVIYKKMRLKPRIKEAVMMADLNAELRMMDELFNQGSLNKPI